mgnify:CR=1 FL=1
MLYFAWIFLITFAFYKKIVKTFVLGFSEPKPNLGEAKVSASKLFLLYLDAA